MNKEFDELLSTQKEKPTKEAETDFIKALEHRRLGIETKKFFASSYELQVSAEDVLVKKEFKEMRCEMPGTPRSTFLMVFSPDGNKVASTHGNHNIYVTDIRTGKNIKTLIGHPRTPWCIAFHPTSNQILASGCLGGQVRIWDLSGGSEVWTSDTQTVIASIAFHPDDRLLVIATYNELYFWDWSKPEPFMHVATGSIKEKVRYVAFDKLGHKLITGISNSPQTRWERVRAPVPVPRQADRAASPYRRRITPRLITNIPTTSSPSQPTQNNREPLSAVPERERRITACYRNLVREYELLVHRYLQIYRPPRMIDQGTDPMEIDLNSITNATQSGPSTRKFPNPLNLTTTSINNLNVPGPSGINSQRASTSRTNNTASTSGSSIKKLSVPKLISTNGTQTTMATCTLSRQFASQSQRNCSNTNTSNVQNVRTSSSNPIDLSRCSTCVSDSTTNNNVSTPRPSTSDVQTYTSETNEETSQRRNTMENPISATQAYEITPSVSSDMLLLTPSEICSLRRNMRNIRSTQTQSTDGSNSNQNIESINAPSTSGTFNINERRNSAPASTISDNQNENTQSLRRGDSEESLIANTTTLQENLKLICESMNSTPNVAVRPSTSHSCTSEVGTSSPSRLVVIRSSQNQNSTQSTTGTQAQNSRRLLIISTSLGTQTSNENNNPPNENIYDNIKMRIRCSTLENNSNTQNTLLKKRDAILQKIKNIIHTHTDDVNSQPSTSSQSRENREVLSTSLLESAEKILSKYLFAKRLPNRNNGPNNSDSLNSPSTSSAHVCNNIQNTAIPPDNTNKVGSSSNAIQPDNKTDLKFYEPRKRVYPGFSKKPRRPILDSSSDSSSSDEDDPSKRRICSSRFPLHSKHFHLNPTTNSTTLQTASSSSSNVQSTSQPTQDSHSSANNSNVRKPLNFNAELELLVTDLLASTEDGNGENSSTSSRTINTNNSANNDRTCGTCGGSIEDRTQSTPSVTQNSNNQPNVESCARTSSNACSRSTININTRTTDTTVYTTPGNPRRRFFSHRLSAFYPTRIQNLRPHSRLRRNSSYLPPAMRNRLRTLNTLQGNNRLPFAVDEVINYSERVNSEEEIPEQPQFHPFDPPPEFATINPENIGIGNMYSNIVQELESSLNDVRNIRASNRLGETSDMLSSFSGRLESIMNQSNAILRNLRTSIDTLTPNDQNVPPYTGNYDQGQQTASSSEPQFLFNDRNFFLREQQTTTTNENSFVSESSELLDNTTSHDDLFSNHNAVATDHTYPLNSRNSTTNTNNMTPLMASLHLTVSHIQRQARLLRQQVESIERIDRAMLEVAQLQMMRQLFVEIQRYFRAIPGVENRNAVSSVRQMMAGTRISDSSPYDSPNEETSTENPSSSVESRPSTSNTTQENQNNTSSTRAQGRKSFPRCIFLMHRNSRSASANVLQRRCLSRERMMRRQIPRRTFTYRSLFPRTPIDLTTNRNTGFTSQIPTERFFTIIRRLELYLMEHGRYIGRMGESPNSGPIPTDIDEYRMLLRLNQCRARMNIISGQNEINNPNIRRQTSSVTADGVSRYGARDVLTSAAESLTRYIDNSANNTAWIRSLLWDVIDLSLLLSEILLLQIVDSIPPPTGMNLDPERESLSARIDQMCSRMLQSRLSGHSQQLTRSLRLTRLAVRHASRALDQTYTARRNAMLPSGNDRDQRTELLGEINNCLRNIRRHHTLPRQSTVANSNDTENLSMTEWYRTIHGLISRYAISPTLNDEQSSVDDPAPVEEQPSTSASNRSNETYEQNEQLEVTGPTSNVQQGSSDDDNEPVWSNNNVPRERARPLYRTNNVYLLNNEDSNSSGSRNRPWNVPTVQVNDVPISQYQSPWHPRFLANRQRLSERLSELRTYPVGGLFRPRFLHPLYAGVNPFDADLDDPAREQIYDSDIITTVTPNHRIQVWEFSTGIIPNINNALKNVVVNECKIHNDASVDIATDGCILVTLLPSGGYLNVTNRLGVYSLDWESLGQCLYVATFEQNAVSVSLSPLSRHLVVGLASRRVSIMPSDNWTMARIFMLDDKPEPCTQLSSVREVEQNRDPNYMSVNCIRWLPISGQGLVYATNTGQLRVLT